jgi:MFS family permease
MTTGSAPSPVPRQSSAAQVIGASSLGTLFEWYDFFLYGSLATLIAAHFFSGVDPATGFIFALATFAVGFIVRPLGALVFGRIGDLAGRKNTFLMTLALMGIATVLVGVLPGYDTLGVAAPIALVTLRLLQGLAIGGEFGGAIVYVAEHAPRGRRGLYTSWIPATAMGGLLLSLLVIMATRAAMTPEAFAGWGWRLPFLFSAILLVISLWIRMRLEESPVFRDMKAANKLSRSPLKESFLRWDNLRWVLLATFGCVVGQAVTFYAGTFYAVFFLERIARVDGFTVTVLSATAFAIGVPLTVLSGWLADRVGRRQVLLGGLALAALLYFPLYGALLSAANPALARAYEESPVIVLAGEDDCSLQFDPMGRRRFDARSCDIVKSYLAGAGVSHETQARATAGPAVIEIGATTLTAPDPSRLAGEELAAAIAAFQEAAKTALADAGYPAAADPAAINRLRVLGILVLLVLLAAATLGSYGALLVELFPARIRYSALSFPQHFGNGWFGGILPAVAFTIVATTGDVFAGLWYPVAIAGLCCLIGALGLPETRDRELS